MNPLGLLVGGRSLAVAGLILATLLFGMGAAAGADAAQTADAVFQDTRGEHLAAMDDASENVSSAMDEPGTRWIYESTAKPMLEAGPASLDAGLWFGYFHPWLGAATGHIAVLLSVLMGIWPFLGGMD